MLETERCKLLDLKHIDFIEIKKLYINHDVRKYLGGIVDEADLKKAAEFMLKNEGESHFWVVRERISNAFMGLVSLTPHHDGEYTEVSYQFMPSWWGKGYGREVVGVVIKYGLKELHLSKIIAETQTANKASCRLLESAGMEREKTLIRFGAEQALYSIERR
ncbi:GNAT family N-acetyltransferase [Bacillus sp. JJ1609]|uniref:GNAT family N-acetyltransferase n=1 Tax=Bacillus sp. JJ1609 TaxID=3122977 RepID=UPI002FFE2EF4